MIGQIIAGSNRRCRVGLDSFRQIHPPLTLIAIRQPDIGTTERIVSVEQRAAKPRVLKLCLLPSDSLFCRTVPSESGQRILFWATLRIPAPAGSENLWKPRSLPATRPLKKFPRSSKRTSSRTLRYKFSSLPSPPRRYGAARAVTDLCALLRRAIAGTAPAN